MVTKLLSNNLKEHLKQSKGKMSEAFEEYYTIQTTHIIKINSKIVDLLHTMDFLGKMEILEVGTINFYEEDSTTIHTDDLGMEINTCTETHPRSGIIVVTFTATQDSISNIGM